MYAPDDFAGLPDTMRRHLELLRVRDVQNPLDVPDPQQLVSVRDLLGPSPGVCLARSSSLLAASGSVATSRRMPLRAAPCQMTPRGTRGLVEAVAPRHAKSPVVEVSPNGHAGAPGSVASAPESTVRAHRIIGSIVHLRLW